MFTAIELLTLVVIWLTISLLVLMSILAFLHVVGLKFTPSYDFMGLF